MKSKLTRLAYGLVGLSFLFFSEAVFADNVLSPRTIVEIYTYADYAIIEYDPPSEHALTDCTTGPKAFTHAVIHWAENPAVKTLLLTALTAYMVKSTVGLGIHSCYDWWGGVPYVYRIDLE